MEIERNKPNITRIGGFRFVPGVNHVPDKIAEKLIHHPQFKHEIKTGSMAILELKGDYKEDSKAPEDANQEEPKINAKEMINIIKNTWDIATLDHFAETDKRKSVQAAIENQREEILTAPEEKEPKSKD